MASQVQDNRQDTIQERASSLASRFFLCGSSSIQLYKGRETKTGGADFVQDLSQVSQDMVLRDMFATSISNM